MAPAGSDEPPNPLLVALLAVARGELAAKLPALAHLADDVAKVARASKRTLGELATAIETLRDDHGLEPPRRMLMKYVRNQKPIEGDPSASRELARRYGVEGPPATRKAPLPPPPTPGPRQAPQPTPFDPEAAREAARGAGTVLAAIQSIQSTWARKAAANE